MSHSEDSPEAVDRVATRGTPLGDVIRMEDEPERLLRLRQVSAVTEPGLAARSDAPLSEIVGQSEVKVRYPGDAPETERLTGGEVPIYGTTQRPTGALPNDVKALVREVVISAVPDLVIGTLKDYMNRQEFEDTIERGMVKVIQNWVAEADKGNPLTALVQTQVEEQMVDKIVPKYVPVPRTDSLDTPQVVTEESRPPYILTPAGGGDPDEPDDDDESDADTRKAKDNRRKKTRKTKKAKRARKSRKKKDSLETETDDSGDDSPGSSSSPDDSDDSTSSSSSDSDSDETEDEKPKKSRKKKKANLKVFVPLNDWYKTACDYRTYRLDDRDKKLPKGKSEKMVRYKRRLEPVMQSRKFSGTDPVTVLSFLNWFQKACNMGEISEGIAVWCFQFCLEGQADSLIHSRLAGHDKIGKKTRQTEKLSTYEQVVNFLIQTYVTNEVISEEYNSMMQFRQATNQTETDFADRLWQKAQRSGIVYSDKHLKSIFADNIWQPLRRSVNTHLSSKAKRGITYQELTRYAQGLGDQLRGATRRVTNQVGFTANRRAPGSPVRTTRALATDWEEDEMGSWSGLADDEGNPEDTVLVISDGSGPPHGVSRGSYSTSRTPSPMTPQVVQQARNKRLSPLHPSQDPTRPGTQRKVTAIVPGLVSCRLCLGRHATSSCTQVPAHIRDRLIEARDKHYQQRREDGTWMPKTVGPVEVLQKPVGRDGDGHSDDPFQTAADVASYPSGSEKN